MHLAVHPANPSELQAEWPLPDGLHGSNSIRAEDLRRWKLQDLLALKGEGAQAAQAAVTAAASA